MRGRKREMRARERDRRRKMIVEKKSSLSLTCCKGKEGKRKETSDMGIIILVLEDEEKRLVNGVARRGEGEKRRGKEEKER